jgi:hypothetical protein
MIKKFFLAGALVVASIAPSHSAGTIPFSLTQQFDSLGHPLVNCFFYSIVAGTTATAQSAYQDAALTIALPNPQRCDASGRLVQMFFADGSIKIRITNSAGTNQVVADNVQVIGNSSGGGGGSPVDPTTVIATGDLKVRYGTGALTGFVRANGRTIGSATSGASERANADVQVLFQYLWDTDANLVVSTGRGVSSAADWAANKTITLPDWRGRALAALDDMGNSAAGRLTATYFGATATTLGAAGGAESKAVVTANLPPYTPAGTFSGSLTATSYPLVGNTASAAPGQNTINGTVTKSIDYSGFSFAGTPQGGVSTPVAVASPMMLATVYLKL